jgi:hypothetical protein
MTTRWRAAFACSQKLFDDEIAPKEKMVRGLRSTNALCGHPFRRPCLVRLAHIRKISQQVFVRADIIPRHLSIGDDGNEVVHDVVGELVLAFV